MVGYRASAVLVSEALAQSITKNEKSGLLYPAARFPDCIFCPTHSTEFCIGEVRGGMEKYLQYLTTPGMESIYVLHQAARPLGARHRFVGRMELA